MWEFLKEWLLDSPSLTFLITLGVFAWVGYLVVTRYLMEKQIRSFYSKMVFIATFMCSLGLLAMYLYEISLINIPDIFWYIILSSLVFISLIVIPISLLFKIPMILKQFNLGKCRVPILAIVAVLAYLRILSYWSGQIKTSKKITDQVELFSSEHVNILVEIIVNYGIYIMALMSAYGAIWCPYIYFNHIDTERGELILSRKKTQNQIFFIIEQIKKNKYQKLKFTEKLTLLREKIENGKRQNESSSLLLKGLRSLAYFSKNKQEQQVDLILQQIDFRQKQLQTLHRAHQESYSIYKQIVEEERKHNLSDTFIGKIFRLFSFILTAYSITKFILTAWNMIKGRELSTDPITRLLNLVMFLLGGQQANQTVRLLSQYISFGFMGYLMISSVRSFSMNIKKSFDFILRRKKFNLLQTDTLVLFISELYGIYFLSAVVLLQSGLPRTYVYDTNFQHLIGHVELVRHFSLFDKLFFWSCICSMVLIFLCQYKKKEKMHYIIKERNMAG